VTRDIDQFRKLFVVKQMQTKKLHHPMPQPLADLTNKGVIRVALEGERPIVTTPGR
jgi:hypothetical protein